MPEPMEKKRPRRRKKTPGPAPAPFSVQTRLGKREESWQQFVRPTKRNSGQPAISSDVDSELRAYLREWRRKTAQENGIAAFVVMHDTSLDEICLLRPTSLEDIRKVIGFGERKTALYGQQILEALRQFQAGSRAAAETAVTTLPAEETMKLLAKGRSFEEIARIRGRQVSSVIDLVARLVEKGDLEFQPDWVDSQKRAQIEDACARLGMKRLNPVKEAVRPDVTFDEIRLVMAQLRRENANQIEP